MKNILLILKNWQLYFYWRSKRAGHKSKDVERGAGFYLDLIGLKANVRWYAEMESGRIGIYDLVKYHFYTDPDDMVRNSWWNFLGYKGMKLIKDCTFEEFLSLYN